MEPYRYKNDTIWKGRTHASFRGVKQKYWPTITEITPKRIQYFPSTINQYFFRLAPNYSVWVSMITNIISAINLVIIWEEDMHRSLFSKGLFHTFNWFLIAKFAGLIPCPNLRICIVYRRSTECWHVGPVSNYFQHQIRTFSFFRGRYFTLCVKYYCFWWVRWFGMP